MYIEIKLWWIIEASKHKVRNTYTPTPKLVYKYIPTAQVT
jgi:hypothetical protein